jgi:hypothetical protein
VQNVAAARFEFRVLHGFRTKFGMIRRHQTASDARRIRQFVVKPRFDSAFVRFVDALTHTFKPRVGSVRQRQTLTRMNKEPAATGVRHFANLSAHTRLVHFAVPKPKRRQTSTSAGDSGIRTETTSSY